MSFTPPPDHSKSFLALAVGAAAGLLIFCLRTNHLAHVGDNTHQLPYGGQYRDGNKIVSYNGPRTGTSSHGSLWPALSAIILTLIIHFRSRTSRRICVRCSESTPAH
nr:TGB2 [Garlic virus X]UUQ75133.1 TGB2 [Garlic virus X]UUQ75139.1 TGB2 [Garlic virus X]UUQ75145.1 TGB2 [Garlic virus X]